MDHSMPNIGSTSENDEENPPPPPEEDDLPQLPQRGDYVPLANVTKIMRDQLPPHAKISDSAKETLQVCVSEYIHHVARVANRRCHDDYRKTITPGDLMYALAELGFVEYVEPLSLWLDEIRAQERCEAAPDAPPRRKRARDGDPSPSTARGT